LKYSDLDEAVEWNNEVEQGLSSSIFTNDVQTKYWFTGPAGTDCGIGNINCPTNGAEIGTNSSFDDLNFFLNFFVELFLNFFFLNFFLNFYF